MHVRHSADTCSRLHVRSFTAEIQFAYRLYDLDGSGSLDKDEAITVLRCACNDTRTSRAFKSVALTSNTRCVAQGRDVERHDAVRRQGTA